MKPVKEIQDVQQLLMQFDENPNDGPFLQHIRNLLDPDRGIGIFSIFKEQSPNWLERQL